MIDICSEYGEIIAIIPFPAGMCSHTVPFNVITDHVLALSAMISPDPGVAMLVPPVKEAVFGNCSGFYVDGWDNHRFPRNVITIRPKPSIKATPKMTVEGTSYTVKITAHTEEDIDHVMEYVNELNSYKYFDLFLISSSDQCFLVRGIEPATSVSFSQQLPLYNTGDVSFEIHCVNGIQLVVPPTA